VPPFLGELANAEPPRAIASQATATPADGRAEIEAAPVARRPVLITALVTRIAAGVVGFAADRQIDPRMPLGELGLDSLMAVDLRNKLGKTLGHRFASTLLFDYPTIGGLADMIGTEVFDLTAQNESKAAAAPPPVQDGNDALLDAIGGLDDEALDRLLAEKLGSSA
jgi:acyl carrier protein